MYNYDLYTTKQLSDTISTATASQLIPGAVLYIPIEEGERAEKAEGELAKYVVEEKEITEDRERYYRIKVDLRSYLKAVNGHITPVIITGNAQIGARKAELVVNVINTPLTVFDSKASKNTIDISQEAAQTFNGNWYVVNNLAVQNTVCGIDMDAHSYQKFTEKEAELYLQCFSGIESNIYDAMTCEDWEETQAQVKTENMISYTSSILIESDEESINYRQFFGTDRAVIYRAIGIDTEGGKDCKPDVAGNYMALLKIEGKIVSDSEEEYNPVVSIVAVG